MDAADSGDAGARSDARRRRAIDARPDAARPADAARQDDSGGEAARRDAAPAVHAHAGARLPRRPRRRNATIGFVSFLNQYGPALVDRLDEELPLDLGTALDRRRSSRTRRADCERRSEASEAARERASPDRAADDPRRRALAPRWVRRHRARAGGSAVLLCFAAGYYYVTLRAADRRAAARRARSACCRASSRGRSSCAAASRSPTAS